MIGQPCLFVGEIDGESVMSVGALLKPRPLLTICEHGRGIGGGWTPSEAVRVFGWALVQAAVRLPR